MRIPERPCAGWPARGQPVATRPGQGGWRTDTGGAPWARSTAGPMRRLRLEVGYAQMDAIEVWNGPWTPDDDPQCPHGTICWSRARGPAKGCRRSETATPTAPQVIGLPHN